MKKHLIVLIAVLTVFLGCAAIGRYKTFVAEDTNSILLTEGATGKQVEITEEAAVRAIAEDVTSLTFADHGKYDGSAPYCSLEFLSRSGNRLLRLNVLDEGGYLVSFGGRRYKVVEGTCVDTELFAHFLHT